MYLKQIELIGFKSFAERTRLDFEPGITAIVGPNGCGKTNIVDSIRWAIGEQSAKSLRGNKMEEVIFHGTDDRRGIGMAEISLTFDNSKKLIPLEFSEVTISRRVFRSGEGQYFINKNLCRLKDVDNIFMDTGIGMRAYSVFEQGKMDLILSSKPEDRRFVFEEAAGISKYKESKKEALHKLEITENNLVRLNDIIKEVQRQLNAIERQAAKARRYKKLSEELKTVEVKLLVHQLKDLQTKSIESEKDKLVTEQKAQEIRNEINLKEARLSELRNAIRQIDAEMAAFQDEKIQAETRQVSCKHEVQYKHNKIEEVTGRNSAIDRELEELNGEQIFLNNNLEGLMKEFLAASAIKSDYRNKLEEKNKIIKSLETNIEELVREIDSAKDVLVGKTSKQSHIKNEISNIELEYKSLCLKERRDYVEFAKKEKQKEKLSCELSNMQGILEIQKATLLKIRQAIKDNEEKMILLKDEATNCSKLMTDKQHYFAEKRSEYELLSNQKRAYEGYSDGVKTIFENKDEFPGVLGLVNNLIGVPDEYAQAINSVLGLKAQWVVVDTLLNACNAAALLHSKNMSQTVFLVLDSLKDEELLENTDTGIRALDIVNYEPGYKKLVEFLLGRIVIVEGMDDIKKLINNLTNKILVTKNGIILDSVGLVTSGKLGGSLENIVSRDKDIDELKVILNNLSGEILEIKDKYNLYDGRLMQEERHLESAKNNLYNEEIALGVAENDYLRTKAVFDSLCEEIQILKLDEQEVNIKKEELNAAKAEKDNELKLISGELNKFYVDIEKKQGLTKEINNKKQNEEREYTELKINLVGAFEKENLLEFKKVEIQRQIDIVSNTIEKITNEKTENVSLVNKLEEETLKLEKEVVEFLGKSTDIENRYASVRAERKAFEVELEEVFEFLRKERQVGDGVYSQLNEKQLKLSQMKLQMDNIIQKLQNEYKLTEDAIGGVSLEGMSIEALEHEVTALRDKMDSLGEVSLMVIEEQDELVKRYEFLSAQRDDLVSAKETLLKTIAKLNTTTKQLFWDTFSKIRENFNMIFCQLFGGGKADLVLIDEQDILESGIDIIARPPGKRLQNVSLLSGGEKALTALALLFSIFKVKPSPFCIMDEIDAPLDDSNIDRFVGLLKEFSKISQFIVVTHNKRTISAADALYGITMQESGVSRIVSVKLSMSDAAR